MRNLTIHLGIVLLGTLWITPPAHSYQVLVSLNTYKKVSIENAVSRVGELKCDGAWLITQNCDFTDAEWKGMLKELGAFRS